MSDLIARLRPQYEYLRWYLPAEGDTAADHELAVDTLAALDALEAAYSRLAAIDALHRGEYDVDPDSFTMGQKFCITDDEEWPCKTHLILHPEFEG